MGGDLRHREGHTPVGGGDRHLSLRSRLKGSYVGGDSAEQIDLEDTNSRDTKIVVPLVLVSVLLILFVLLRSLVAPLVLVAAVVAVWGAALGIGGLAFRPVLGLEGTDPGLGRCPSCSSSPSVSTTASSSCTGCGRTTWS
ncbi:MMPL family transporter [Streptomyces longwoodensis]|nr:MMPL family transporter [Streptomyces longwoodensis]